MAGEISILGVISNETLTSVLPPELSSSIGTLILILKTAGILFIIYVLFLIITGVMNIICGRRIKKILEKVCEIEEKLDKVIGKKSEKKEDSVKKENKKKEKKS